MGSLLSFLLLLSSLALAFAAQQGHQNIGLDSTLHPTTTPTSWLSPSGRFAFGFYPEGSGFKVGIWLIMGPRNHTVIWTASRDEAPVSKDVVLSLTNEGIKFLVTTGDKPITQYWINGDASSASMLDSGNFVIYGPDFGILWQSFDYPTDTIMAGQALQSGNELISSISETNRSEGRFMLKMQSDGNLVTYPVDSLNSADNAYWSSETYQKSFTSVNLDNSGRLYLFDGNLTKNLTDQHPSRPKLVYRATLDPDGIFRLYSHDLERNDVQVVDKFPDTDDLCMVKGTCGLNSYCTYAKEQLVCWCLPGFNYTDAKETADGCSRDFPGDSCSESGEKLSYSMNPLQSVVWWDDSYATLESVTTKEECSNLCLEDCNCGAVIFTSTSTCTKQKLPLRYGRTDSQDSSVTFVKVGNGTTTTITTTTTTSAAPAKKGSSQVWIPIVAAIGGIMLIFVLVLSFLILYWHRRGSYIRIGRNRALSLADEIGPISFTHLELRDATDGFKEDLGRGSFGTVFKGALPNDGTMVAVKRLEKDVGEGEREFRTEMRVIGRTHHKNLVRLIGFCDEGSNRLLVYELMRNGSLADLIFKPEGLPSWGERGRIVLDIARGIHYLHEECDTPIIHCDIKPQNILMDENWNPKISDFGLAKLLTQSQTRTFTQIRGTRGYLAPEWHQNLPISVKADVYSFGVVLLETVCCRRSLELEAESEEIVLLKWVSKCLATGELEKLVSDEEADMRELERLVKVGLLCIQDEPAFRPSMRNVVMMLEGNMAVSFPPPPSSSPSSFMITTAMQ